MKKTVRLTTGAILVVAIMSGGRTSVRADDKKDKSVEAYAMASQPGPQHKRLATMAGSWTFKSKMWEAPGQPPQEWTGTAERKMILGGRYLQEEVTSSFAGMPFHGLGINGYDNVQGKYVGTWMDNMSCGMSRSVGTADASGTTITYDREEFDPITKAKAKGRDVLHLISADKETLVFNKILPDGKEFKMMEIEYSRKK